MSLIHVNHLTFSYEGNYDTIFDDISFQIDTDWKLGFIGRNGRGKTTFLRLLMGEEGYEGQIFSSVEFAYFPYEVKNTDDMALDVAEQIIGQYEYWQLSREIHLLELDEQVLYRPYKSLSQGERTKLLLAALFLREDRFLLIDEPTNHLDVHGRELVSRYLSKKKGFILVSHDRSFLDRCIDHVLCLNRSTICLLYTSRCV